MQRGGWAWVGLLLVMALGSALWRSSPRVPRGRVEIAAATAMDGRAAEPLHPLPPAPALDPARVALGRRLFEDPVLSRDSTISCATCHDLARGGMDGLPRSVGIAGRQGLINAPTVLNATLNFRQFWDGRAATLEAQVDGPIRSSVEMANDWPTIVHRLERTPRYADGWRAVFGHAPEPADVASALADFERTLLTPSRFDDWLRGDPDAIGAQESRGYRLFKSYGCVSCHQGANVGGNMFQVFGVVEDGFGSRPLTSADLGRFAVTGDSADLHVFKVPSLRNVALTAPYFHDGSAATLDDAVRTMARVQLGRHLEHDEVQAITAFLASLTGRLPVEARPVASVERTR